MQCLTASILFIAFQSRSGFVVGTPISANISFIPSRNQRSFGLRFRTALVHESA